MSYRQDLVLNTEEEDRLDEQQRVKEKVLGVKQTKLKSIPRTGNNIQPKIRELEKKEYQYRIFRKSLKKTKPELSKIKDLDEMISDFNYLQFNQHLFSQFNELVATKQD